MLLTQKAAAVQAHTEMRPVFFQPAKGLWTLLEQLRGKPRAVVRNREGEQLPLQGKGELQLLSGITGRVAD